MSEKNESINLIKIDATGKIFGRLASEVAILLRGKDLPSFRPNTVIKRIIKVFNIRKIKFSGRKIEKKTYHYHTGYPGGLKTIFLKNLFDKNPEKAFIKTVYGMLPKNKLRQKMIKNLKVS